MAGFKEYTMMFQLSAATSAQFSSAFSGAQAQISQLQSKIETLNRKQGDITAYTKQQAAVEKTKSKLEVLKQQYDNLKKAQEEAGGSNVDLQNKMLDKQHQIDKTTDSLNQQTQKLNAIGTALNEAGVDTSNLANESQRLEAELSDLRTEQEAVADSAQESGQSFQQSAEAMQSMLLASGVVDLLESIGDALNECTDASIQYETAMAGVKRTVGGNDAFIRSLGDDFKYLSTVIPITSTDLAGIATNAGQLGIAQDYVREFTEVMAKLATTTDLTSDDASTMLAQFTNITGTKDYQRLGSAVASLGDATATTASKVVEMSQGMAAAGTQAGMSSTDILGIAAAVGSLGIESASGSTAMSTLISTLYKAVETGEDLDKYASVANMTAQEFSKAWRDDAAGALDSFINGLNDVERNGKSAIVVLDELGINNVRQTRAILGLASANGLLTKTIAQANDAWTQNTALDEKAAIMYETTESKVAMMKNAYTNVKIAVGDALTPAMGDLAQVATAVLQPVSEFLSQHPALIRALTAGVGVLAAVTGGVLALSAAFKVASVAGALMTASIPGLPLILGITAGVAGLTAAAVGLASVLGDAGMSFEELDAEFDSSMQQIEEQSRIVDLCDEYRDLQEEIGITRSAIKSIQSAGSVGIHLTADVAAQLTAEDFVDTTSIELTAQQANALAAADFIPDGTMLTLTAKAGNALAAAGFLDSQKVLLTAEAANELLAKGYLDDDQVELFAQQGNYIEGVGFVTDTMIELTPEAAAYLAGTDFLEGSEVQLTPEAAAYLNANGFLVDSKVELTPEAAAYLAAEGFLTGTDVKLTPEAAEKLAAAGFLDGTEVVLYGSPDESKLSVDDFVEDGRLVTITADLDVAAATEKLSKLQGEITSVGNELSAAKSTLDSMQAEYDELNLKMLSTNETVEKAAYAEQMATLSEKIEDQKTVVSQLSSTYESLNSEYSDAQAVVDQVSQKEAQLAEIKQELVAASGGLITATDSETEAFNGQVDALQALAELKQSELRAQAYNNIVSQAKDYASAVQNAAYYQEQLDAATVKQTETVGLINGGLDDMESRLFDAQDKLHALINSDTSLTWDSESVQAYVSEIEDLLYVMTGEKYDFHTLLGLDEVIALAETSYDGMNEAWSQANADVEEYARAVAEADATQQTFLDNLVSGVVDGGMSLEYLEGLLNEQFNGVEGGAEIVATAMAYVREHVEMAAEASEDMGDGFDDASDSAADLQTAIEPIVKEMEDLAKAYDEAYKSAYESIDGQFDLFEKVNTIKISPQFVNTGDNSMREGLESQAKYMEEYVAMLQKAQEIGVNTDLLASLADGSMESAETLKRLVSESTTAEDIEALNASYELVQQKKAEFATTTAEIQTDFTEKMTALEEKMATTISEMDMSAEAAANARSTFQSMISEADTMLPLVRAAYARIAAAAQSALNNIHAPNISIPGYAVGTKSAETGYAIVGENGPELVYFGGGEEVYTAAQTQAMLTNFAAMQTDAMPMEARSYADFSSDSSSAQIVFAPSYTITGATNADELRDLLRAHDEELMEQFEQMMSDVESDRERRKL